MIGTAKINTRPQAVLGRTHDIDPLLLIGTAKIHTRPWAVLGGAHDIDHLLLNGTAKIHTCPNHIVVSGQCLAALRIFTTYY